MTPNSILKQCSKCGLTKEEAHFYKDKQKSDGLTSSCKDCVKAYQETTKKERSEYNKTRRPNKEKNKAANRLYHQQHKEEIKEKRKGYLILYRKEHAQTISDYSKKYYQKNKNRIQERQMKTLHKSQSQQFVLFARRFVSLVIKPTILQRDSYQCQLCFTNANLVIHHIIPLREDSSLKSTISDTNLITLCKRCHLLAHDGCHSRIDLDIQKTLLQRLKLKV